MKEGQLTKQELRDTIEMLGTHLDQIRLRDDRLIEMDRAALRAAMELTARLRRHAR